MEDTWDWDRGVLQDTRHGGTHGTGECFRTHVMVGHMGQGSASGHTSWWDTWDMGVLQDTRHGGTHCLADYCKICRQKIGPNQIFHHPPFSMPQ